MHRKLYLMNLRCVPSFIFLLFLYFNFDLCECTDIKWESAAKERETDRAKIAPKSQRYWDEHNIERPEYAKTDAEVAAEAGERAGLLLSLIGVLLVTFSLFVAHFLKYRQRQFGAGQRLGSNDSSNALARLFSSPSTKTNSAEEQARQARLEHFEKQARAKDE